MIPFSVLLRRCRSAANLTQAELARRAGVGVRTVRDLERGRSSRPQRTTVELLAAALGVAGDDRTEFFAAARGQTPTAGRGPASAPGRALPPPVDLAGRDDGDVAESAESALRGGEVVGLVGLALGTIGLALAQDGRLPDAAAVLAELRGWDAPSPERSEDGLSAVIEASMALHRGERAVAAEWFAAAAEALTGGDDPRYVVEALVGLVATTDDDAARKSALERLAEICRNGAVTLLPRQRALIGSAEARRPAPGGGVDSRH
ncbi:Helix-turn-helix domain-containing protein [Micromonospora pattaloongensis]|uniref:Helix-turn-helix domain-containing protein n=2 Tax=Micromonospora pattaloongensis TaxID=405436 RepID=A0A1H3HY84_9ACTN|nr:Helix-turn-helix domain-containing protein [Micromonospora pattaloongensis]